MTRSAALLVLWLGASCAIRAAASDQPGALTPESMLARIKNDGAAAVVQSLWYTPKWYELTDQVASGNPNWVNVAIALSPGTDAGATEELQDALFVGLGQNPAYELKVLPVEESEHMPLSVSSICSGRTDPPDDYSKAITELRGIAAAVEKVQAFELEPKKRLCLGKMKSGAASLKRYFGVS